MTSDFQCRLVSFDLDGTLVPKISSGGFLAKKMGHEQAMLDAENLYAQGKVPNDYVSTLDGQFYAGRSKAQIFELLADIPKIQGIQETVDHLQARMIPSVCCTLAWNFVAEYFSMNFGFIAWSGPTLEYGSDGLFTGNIDQHFDEFGKPVFIKKQCSELNIDLNNVVHIGDSRSDIELFKQAGFSIAINATEQAKSFADVSIDTDCLTDILSLIPNLAV